MNKRIKLKKGILHKKCDDSCHVYRCIKLFSLFTNIGFCNGCRLQRDNAIKDLLKSNISSNVTVMEEE